MLNWQTWCALVVGTGIGAGGTVTVDRVAPRHVIAKAAHRTKLAAKPKPAPAAMRSPEPRAPLQD